MKKRIASILILLLAFLGPAVTFAEAAPRLAGDSFGGDDGGQSVTGETRKERKAREREEKRQRKEARRARRNNLPTVEDSIDVEGEKPQSVKEWINSQPRKKKGAIKGAIRGALAGLAGALVLGKDPMAGIAAGAATGALVGYLVGRRKDKIYAARDAAVAEVNYDPSQGYVIQIQEVRFDPPQLLPGQTSQLYVRYLVVGPNPKEKIVVQSYTGLKYDDNYVFGSGPDKFTVPRGGGIVETTMDMTIPAEAPPGSYMAEAQFEERDGRFKDQGTGPLYVTGGEEGGEAAEGAEATG